MIYQDLNEQRIYIVTVKRGVDWKILHDEIIRDTSADASVDSNIIPDRACEASDEMPLNPRVIHYRLSENEKIKLSQDPRILSIKPLECKGEYVLHRTQSGSFNKTSSQSGQHDNWGLIRHIKTTNVYGNNTSNFAGTYDYVLDGTGVDIVVMDTGVQADHPEWEDANGVSRLKQIDWYTASGLAGTQPADFYTDLDGHGSHCIGTVAGKTFGWAKNADIYSIQVNLGQGGSGSVSVSTGYQLLLGWHNKKMDPNDPAYTGRPTVVNMSFGNSCFLHTSTTPIKFSFQSGSDQYDITGGRYRGTTHTDTDKTTLTGYGVTGSQRSSTLYQLTIKESDEDATIESLIDAGIHVCISAGNSSLKVDLPGGTDYENYLEVLNSNYRFYYHRGGSPAPFEGGEGFPLDGNAPFRSENPTGDLNDGHNVGAVDTTAFNNGGTYVDKKATFSNSGPGVNIYSAGTYIISAQPSNQGSTYFANSSYRQAKYSGTSMASPQIAGIIACLLHAHPDWTPGQIKKYLESNSTATLYETGNNNDFDTNYSIHGGNNRMAYFPMNGQRPFNIG
jgi:hypothetical protein